MAPLIITFFILAKASLYLRPKSVNKNLHIACEKTKSKHHSHSVVRDPSAAFISGIKLLNGYRLLVLLLIASIVFSGEALHTNRSDKGLDVEQANRNLGLHADYSNLRSNKGLHLLLQETGPRIVASFFFPLTPLLSY